MNHRRTITGFSNPTVKVLRSLRDKKHRKREGKFLAEGLRLLTDARECGRLPETLVMALGRDEHPLLGALEADVIAAGGEACEPGDEQSVANGAGFHVCGTLALSRAPHLMTGAASQGARSHFRTADGSGLRISEGWSHQLRC